jgi:hypothetical protein
MKSRLEGSLDDFIFIESPKVIIKKGERGTHVKLVTVHGKTKIFKRKQRVGRKDKEVKKSSLHPDNLQRINDLHESGIIGIVGGMHENETYICRFKDGSLAIHKTMKAGDIVGEVGTYETSKILDWDIVPETIQCDYGKGEGSCQKWIPDSDEVSDGLIGYGIRLDEKHLNDLSKIFVMDMILGNYDRHTGNIIIGKNDHVWAIDNEMWGKRNNAELHIESLENHAKSGESFPVPMMNILENSFGDNVSMYQNFKDHVDKNIDIMINKKDEISKYWSQYKYSNIKAGGAVPVNEAIEYIEKNIKYLENYRGKND